MAVFGTNDAKVLMPRTIADGMVKQAKSLSTVAQLSPREPMRFGEVDIITFNDIPKMEYVEESGEKSSSSTSFGSVKAKPHKGQVTLRFSNEVEWADEDQQLGVLREVADAGQVALSRGLDLGLLHRINPLSGTVITGWDNYVTATTKNVEQATGDADDDFRAAVGLLMSGSTPSQVNGAAIDPRFAWALSNLKKRDGSGETSDQRYPQLGFGTNITDFMGVPTAVGDTVSGTPEAADTGVRAIVGDFVNGIRWGVQRELPIEIIRFGDPDGQGDLKRKNEIALRLEIVYGWYAFVNRFAVVQNKVA
ncbi:MULTISPECIES: phage major capsid protein [unclassified Agrococcus]|uniref:phage major capsid family protein n=1 Tax=unclassified Agrococcus TaxID=2615065 RepID=UPI00361F0A5B